MDLMHSTTVNLMGVWVAVSCLSGLLVFLVIKFFDWLFLKQSSSDKYHKSVAGLVFFFLLNIAFTYYFYNYDTVESESSFYVRFDSLDQSQDKTIINENVDQVFTSPESNTSDFFASNRLIKSLGIFWLIGALVFTIKMLGGYFYTRSLILHNQREIPKRWNEFIQEQLDRLNIKKGIKVFESDRISYAFTFGFLRPLVALPLGFFTTLPSEQIEAVLLHELHHIKNKDYLINLLTMTLEVIFFYHPLMWWLAKNIRTERENSCDDQVTQIMDKKVYAHALLNMESYRQSLNYVIPFSTKQSNLKTRIMRIFEQKPELNVGLKPFLSLLMIVVFLMGFTFYKLEEPKEKSNQEEIAGPTVQPDELESPKQREEKVLFKLQNDKWGLVLVMTKHTLIAKSDKDVIKLYIDEKLYPLNEIIPLGKKEISTMYHSDEGLTHHFFSHHYFESHDRDKWDKENRNRDTYVFYSETKSFVFRPAENSKSEPINFEGEEISEKSSTDAEKANSLERIDNKPANLSSFEIFGPITISSGDDSKLIDSSNLELLKKLVKKHGSDENAEVQIRIDGKLLAEGKNISNALGIREIKRIKIISPSKDAESGLIEIFTDAIAEEQEQESLQDVSVEQNGEDDQAEEEISISIEYETDKHDFIGDMKMSVGKENVLDALGIYDSDILFVIDGIEKKMGYKPTNDIDPNDIQSITVLKDKKAVRKYGKKAKNGVVEIYLKKE
jgi:beta-lactamase regulating signal transducer with metallopeptidase domain